MTGIASLTSIVQKPCQENYSNWVGEQEKAKIIPLLAIFNDCLLEGEAGWVVTIWSQYR